MELINTRSAHCIYCDDVRREHDGKLTLVGVYPDEMPIPFPAQGPLVLPKFCVICTIRAPHDQPLKSVRCELKVGEEIIHAVKMPELALKENPQRLNQDWHTMQMIMEFGNFVVAKAGILRFVVFLDEAQRFECHALQLATTSPRPSTGATG